MKYWNLLMASLAITFEIEVIGKILAYPDALNSRSGWLFLFECLSVLVVALICSCLKRYFNAK